MRSLATYVVKRSLPALALLAASATRTIAATQAAATTPIQPSGEPGWKDIALLASQILTVVISVVALRVSVQNTKTQVNSSEANANAQRWRDANQKEIEQLEALLRTFHMPYLVRAEANNNMAQDLRNRFGDPNYRMLIKLFDPTWLNGLPKGDKALVDEVCRTGMELRKFIEDNSGGVDSKLADHLARASTHFRVLSLAHDGQLGTDPKPFTHYVYPRQLDRAIEADRKRILRRLAALRAGPSENHGIIAPLSLPDDALLDPWPNPLRPQP
jgi:hypothetical protein